MCVYVFFFKNKFNIFRLAENFTYPSSSPDTYRIRYPCSTATTVFIAKTCVCVYIYLYINVFIVRIYRRLYAEGYTGFTAAYIIYRYGCAAAGGYIII